MVAEVRDYTSTGRTNESVSCLVNIEKLKGPVDFGPVKAAFEVYEFFSWGEITAIPGDTGLLPKNATVRMGNVEILIHDSSEGPNFGTACFHGTDLGKVTITYLITIGGEPQKLFEIVLINSRISSTSLAVLYDPNNADNAPNIISTKGGINEKRQRLIGYAKETPARAQNLAISFDVAFSGYEFTHCSYEDDAKSAGNTATKIDLTKGTVSA